MAERVPFNAADWTGVPMSEHERDALEVGALTKENARLQAEVKELKRIVQSCATSGEIVSVAFHEVGAGFRVGQEGVTRITQSDRNGDMAAVPTIQVWKGDHLWMEMDKGHVLVEYEVPVE
jgi:hypothetical protein